MPYSNLALMPTERMGPPPGAFAADAHDCIMVRIKPSYRIQVCSAKMRAHGELPSDPLQTGTHRSPKLCKSPIAVHRRCACSGVKACPWLEQGALRNTSDARRHAAKLRACQEVNAQSGG